MDKSTYALVPAWFQRDASASMMVRSMPECCTISLMTYMSRSTFASLALGLLLAAPAAGAQATIERTAQISGPWVADPGVLEVQVRPLLARRGGGLHGSPGVAAGYGVLPRLMASADIAIQSLALGRVETEWQILARYLILDEVDDPLELALSGGYNGAAGSVDGELSFARWIGPARALAVVRAFSDAFDSGEGRLAAGGGLVVHPLSGRVPLALAGDILWPARRSGRARAWSVAAQGGIPRTQHTLSLFVTNGSSSTLQGSTWGARSKRVGLEFTFRVPIGRTLEAHTLRSAPSTAVRATDGVPGVFVDIRNFLFAQRTIHVAEGATIEWFNHDNTEHSVRADGGTWGSGPIAARRSWRASFDRPGRYAYRCELHPYMRGLVIVD